MSGAWSHNVQTPSLKGKVIQPLSVDLPSFSDHPVGLEEFGTRERLSSL